MESVTLLRGVIYRHIEQPTRLAELACPECGGRDVAFHSHRTHTVEHLDPECPCFLVLKLAKYACPRPECPRKYFTPPVAEAACHAHTSRRLQETAKDLYRSSKDDLREVEGKMRRLWHTGTGKTSILRWHTSQLGADCPKPEALAFSRVLCIDEVYDHVGGKSRPIFTAVDPIAGITVRIPVEKADSEHLSAAMEEVRRLGAEPEVVVSDLWPAYPEALRKVWPRAERQLCWFHVQQWVTRKLASLIKEYGEGLAEEKRKRLNRLRFRLLAAPEKRERLSGHERVELAEAWDLIAGTIVEEAIRLRDDLRKAVGEAKTRSEARWSFDRLRKSWPEEFRPWTWRPGEEIPGPRAQGAGPEGLAGYLHAIMAFFVRHFEMMICYLGKPGVPRTSNHAERANRNYRAISRVRYGWKTDQGLRAFLIVLQGFDSS